jgi:acetyl-CoA carboxylase biotin carboxyl carrier protein
VGCRCPFAEAVTTTQSKVRAGRLRSNVPAVGIASDRRSKPFHIVRPSRAVARRVPEAATWPPKAGPASPFNMVPASEDRQEGAVAEVEAHITGTVWKIECAVGDEIEEGDTVVILESMKMEMPVEAEDAGVVKEILCEEGQAVNEGDTLVILE